MALIQVLDHRYGMYRLVDRYSLGSRGYGGLFS